MVWRALGETSAHLVASRAMVGGPHEVGGAEPGAERLLNTDSARFALRLEHLGDCVEHALS